MAKIRSIRLVAPSAVVHPTEVDAEAREVSTPGGPKYLQLSTFGSDARKSEPKVSQTVQFDRDQALALRELINTVFGRE